MPTYYIDSVNGNDANNGLGPDASDLTNKPWRTIAHAIGAGGTVVSGDTVYLSPAGPFREAVTVAITPASTVSVIGDVANKSGFKTSGGVTVTAGPVVWTAYTTDDKTAPSANAVANLSSKPFWAFQNIVFVGGTGQTISSTTGCHDVTFTDCAFLCGGGGSGGGLTFTSAFATALNLTFDRCFFFAGQTVTVGFVSVTLTTGVGSDYDAAVLFRNSMFLSQGSNNAIIRVVNSGASANKGGGVRARNCTFYTGGVAALLTTTNISTTIPCVVDNCIIMSGKTASLSAGTAGQITEDWNVYQTAPVNVTAGTHSVNAGTAGAYAPMLHFGQEAIWGGQSRIFGEPMASSPFLGFGGDGSQTSYDLRNGPRPAGGASASPAVGALERSNTARQASSPVPPSGTFIWQGTGPWYEDFQLPVDTSSTTVAVSVQRDANYTGTAPQLLILENDEIGVTGSTTTDVGASGAWNTVTAPAFTATRAGFVTVRVFSGDTSGISVVEFADFVVS